MFEKEAEEYARLNNPAEYGVRATHFTVLNSYKDGAEFGYNKAKEEMQEQGLALQSDMDKTIEQNIALKKQIEKMKKYIKACWVEENLNDYSSYITNTSDEFRDLVKELDNEVRNGR